MEQLQELGDYFRSRPEALLAYAFGSASQGATHALSDVDIAVLLDEARFRELDCAMPWGYQASVSGELASVLHRNDVDLVLLHSASPLLKYQVVRFGKVLYSRSETIRVGFEVRARQEYLDTTPLRSIQREHLYRSIREGRFGQPKARP